MRQLRPGRRWGRPKPKNEEAEPAAPLFAAPKADTVAKVKIEGVTDRPSFRPFQAIRQEQEGRFAS